MKLDRSNRYVQSWIKRYDREMAQPRLARFYDNTGFFNYGYWTPGIASQGEASANLVEKLLSWLPDKSGNILDLACGMGGSTKLLQSYYKPEAIIATNYSTVQLKAAGELAPGSNFVSMDGATLALADASIDNIICVESAFHFNSRKKFLQEALRVLKPGGRLVHTDIVTRRKPVVHDNALKAPSDLGAALRDTGFTNIEVVDATKDCWVGFSDYLKRYPGQERRAGRMGMREFMVSTAIARGYGLIAGRVIKHYVLSQAQKPAR